MVDPRKLSVFLGMSQPADPTGSDPSDLPTRVEAGYVPANPDGTTKNCKNCWKWVQARTQCLELGDTPVTADMVCTLHNFGVPTTQEPAPTMGQLLPSDVGLEVAPLGTSCISCMHFDAGFCRAVQDEGTYAQVEPLGCCNRWSPRG